MGKTLLLVAVLVVAGVTTPTPPVLAQLAGEGPTPPEYQVTEDGTLIVGGDILVDCAAVGLEDHPPGADDPAVRAGIERSLRESARACESAGFPTAAEAPSGDSSAYPGTSDAASASPAPSASATDGGGTVLPQTGGPVLPLLVLGAGAVAAAYRGLSVRR